MKLINTYLLYFVFLMILNQFTFLYVSKNKAKDFENKVNELLAEISELSDHKVTEEERTKVLSYFSHIEFEKSDLELGTNSVVKKNENNKSKSIHSSIDNSNNEALELNSVLKNHENKKSLRNSVNNNTKQSSLGMNSFIKNSENDSSISLNNENSKIPSILEINSIDDIESKKTDKEVMQLLSMSSDSCSHNLSSLILNQPYYDTLFKNLAEKDSIIESSVLLPSTSCVVEKLHSNLTKDKTLCEKMKNEPSLSKMNCTKIISKIGNLIENSNAYTPETPSKKSILAFNFKGNIEILKDDICLSEKHKKQFEDYIKNIETRMNNYNNNSDKKKYSSNEGNNIFRIIYELKTKAKRLESYIKSYIPTKEALKAGLIKENKSNYKDLDLVKKQLGFKQMLLKINLLRSLLESTLYGGFKLLQDDKK